MGLHLGVLPAMPSVYNWWHVLRTCLWCRPEADPSGPYPRTTNGVSPGRHRLHCGSGLWPIPRARTPVWQEVAVYRTVCTGAPVVLSWGEPPGYTPVCCPHAGFDTKLGPPSSPFDAHSTN